MAELSGKYAVTVHTFIGDQFATHELKVEGDKLTGVVMDNANGSKVAFDNGETDGTNFKYSFEIKASIGLLACTIEGSLQEDGSIKGTSTNPMGSFEMDGKRI